MQTILVCDDDKEIVEAIEIYLQQEGYHILKAYDGEGSSSDHGCDDAASGRNPCDLKNP